MSQAHPSPRTQARHLPLSCSLLVLLATGCHGGRPDQANEAGDITTNVPAIAQSFMAGETGVLTGISFFAQGNIQSDVEVSLHLDAPQGTSMASSVVSVPNTGEYEWVMWELEEQIVEGQIVCLVVQLGDDVSVTLSGGDQYTGGHMWIHVDDWIPQNDDDLLFRTYIDPS